MVWLNGRGDALHYEAPDEIVGLMIRFAKRAGGKVSQTLHADGSGPLCVSQRTTSQPRSEGDVFFSPLLSLRKE